MAVRSFWKNLLPAQDRSTGITFILLSQFGLAFSFNVVMSFMPFYIIRISPYGEHETTIWIGLIMGLQSFVAAATAPFWGSLTAKLPPKRLFQASFLVNAVTFLLMGFTTSLPLLLALRLIQGIISGASTIGLFMISELSPRDRLAGQLSLYQNVMTAGSLLAPPVGAYLAAHLGYRAPFIVSVAMISVFLLLVQVYVAEIDKRKAEDDRRPSFDRGILWGWVLSFIATIHLSFLPSILPHVTGAMGLAGEKALKAAGFVMMGYTATSIVGSLVISRMTPKARLTGVIAAACLAAAFFQALLAFPREIVGFTVVRMIQTGVVAAVIPLAMANFGAKYGGKGLGFLNSARFAGMGAAPLMATLVLAESSLITLYGVIAAATAGTVLAFWLDSRKISGGRSLK